MDRYPNLILLISFLLLISSFNVQSQNFFSDSVYCYLELNNNQKKTKKQDNVAYQMKLFIHNESSDSIVIADFNKYIHHISTGTFRETEKRIFYWDLLTVSNEEPEVLDEDVLIVTVLNPVVKMPKEKNMDIIIPPHKSFIYDVMMLYPLRSFRVYPQGFYPKGFYKLCLFYENDKNCVAETIIEIEQ